MARILVESGPLKGEAITLQSTAPLQVGRDPACPLRVADARVSRVHFVLEHTGTGFRVEDRSRNGTFVNGKRVKRWTLRPGDMIRLGGTFLSYFEDDKDPLLGTIVDGYKIISRVGRGAMGTVYRAQQRTLERVVALKVLAPEMADDPEFIRRFVGEAQAAARLSHPNVVQVYNAGEAAGVHYLSMEYMSGGSLQEILDVDLTIPPERCLPFAFDALRALIWAEELGIVHRDIKPDNLMIHSDGTLKLADFGIAADVNRSKTLHQGGKVVGTPLYMAPEQALGQPADHRVDIYALGSTLYTALSGGFPFDGETPTEILVKKSQQPPRPLADLAPHLPADLVGLIHRMIATKPEDRPSSSVEVLEELREIHQELKEMPPAPVKQNGGARNLTRPKTTQIEPGATPRRRAWVIVAAAAALVIVGVLVGWMAGWF